MKALRRYAFVLPLLHAACLVAAAARTIGRRPVMPGASGSRSLVPISLAAAKAVLGPNPTREQLAWHWGSLGRAFEKLSISSFGPLILAYVNEVGLLGGLEATILGSLAASYFVWGPAAASLGRGSLLVARSGSAALFFGRVAVAEQELDEAGGRVLELTIDDGATDAPRFVIWAPWRDEYEAIRVGMPARLLVLRAGLGRSAETTLVSEAHLPTADLYFGEYPDLNRLEFELLTSQVVREIDGVDGGVAD
jgi:hypothetical protein